MTSHHLAVLPFAILANCSEISCSLRHTQTPPICPLAILLCISQHTLQLISNYILIAIVRMCACMFLIIKNKTIEDKNKINFPLAPTMPCIRLVIIVLLPAAEQFTVWHPIDRQVGQGDHESTLIAQSRGLHARKVNVCIAMFLCNFPLAPTMPCIRLV